MKYLAVIPARKHSKRIPHKNMILLHGKPLVQWSIESAVESKYIDGVVVTTDDEKVVELVESNYSNVICCNRDRYLCDDEVGLTPVLNDVAKKYISDNVVLLRPTSPLRINNIIDRCISKFEAMDVDSFCTGFVNKEVPAFTCVDMPSQLRKGWFQNDGCVEIHRSKVVIDNKPYGDLVFCYPVEQYYSYEVDTVLDLLIVDFLFKNLNGFKG